MASASYLDLLLSRLSAFFFERAEFGLEPALGDQCRHDRAEDHRREEDRVLSRVASRYMACGTESQKSPVFRSIGDCSAVRIGL